MSGAVGGKGSTAVAAGFGRAAPDPRVRGQGSPRLPRARWPRFARPSASPPPEGHRRDRLIEHLHCLQDAHGALREGHLVALAGEMRLSMAEVYEVASFYHHFDIVADDAAVAPRTLRVCTGLSCQLAGAQDLLDESAVAPGLGRRAGARRALHRPLRAGAGGARRAACGRPCRASTRWRRRLSSSAAAPVAASPIGYAAYRAAGGYALAAALARGEYRAEAVIARWRTPACADSAARAFPAGRKWRIVRDQPAPRYLAVNIDEGEPGTFKDRTYLERDPHRVPRGRADRRDGSGHRARVDLPARRVPRGRAMLQAELAALAGRSALPAAGDRAAPRRRRLHLRRGVGDAREHRRQARRAADAPALHRAGGPVRPADAGAQLRDAVLGARHRRARAGLVRRLRPPRPPRAALVLRQRPGARARRQARAGGHHAARTGRRVLRRHGRGPRALRLPARRRLGRHPAGGAGRRAAGLRHPAAARGLHRLGGHHRARPPRPGARRGADDDALLRRRELRPVHALPRRHRQGGAR